MDLVTHALTGGALAGTGLRRVAQGATAVLVLSSVAPDVDIVAYLWDPYTALAFRRGWTHGPLAALLLPPLLAAAVVGSWRLRRPDGSPGAQSARLGRRVFLSLVGLAYLAFVLHVLMDWLNSYGVRFWMPFDPRWSYGDSLFILDPWLWVLLGGAWVVGRKRQGERRARLLLWMALAFVGVMVGSRFWARHWVLREVADAGWAVQEAMVGPRLANPFVRDVVIRTGEGYRRGSFHWLEGPKLFWNPEPWPEVMVEVVGGESGTPPQGEAVAPNPSSPVETGHTEQPLKGRFLMDVSGGEVEEILARARRHPAVARYLVWSRFPFYRLRLLSGSEVEVVVGDARYPDFPTGRGGLGGVTVRLMIP